MTLEPHERQGLTIWCQHFSAQIQRFHNLDGSQYTQLAFNVDNLEEDEDYCKIINVYGVRKLRELLNEAHDRGYLV